MLWLFLSKRYKEGYLYFFSSRRWHTRYIGDWSSDACSSDLSFTSVLPVITAILWYRSRARVSSLGRPLMKLPAAELTHYAHSAPRRNIPRRFRRALIRARSEERRVGKECRCRWARERERERV